MPVAAETAGGERVVHTTQTRLTPTGQEHQAEGEGVDLLAELLELVGCPKVNDDESEKDFS